MLFVTVIVMHCAVICTCCRSGRRQEYVCVAFYCNCNALRSDVHLLSVWTASGIRLCCFFNAIVLHCAVMYICCWSRRRKEYVSLLVTANVMHCALI